VKRSLRRRCAHLPNLITFVNLLCGVTAIMLAVEGHFLLAPVAVFVAGGLDVLDGALARRLRGADPFGEALDSLADIISFGVAPALLVYEAFLRPWPVLGWMAAGCYVIAGGWRLARFTASERGLYFQGLPITMGGMSSAALLFYRDFWSPGLVAALLPILAALMVSHLRFPKIPVFLGRLPLPAQLLSCALVLLAARAFLVPNVIVVLGLTYYAVSFLDNVGVWGAVAGGPVGEVIARLRQRS
jgi:CDP-diacylglycerol--serine O-phosphatidyltransferase